MKLFKRVIILAVSAAVAVLSFPGCDILFGKRCTHRSSGERGYNEQSHYRICADCGGNYDFKSHSMVMTYLNGDDTTQHFMKCLTCDYSHSYEPHVMSDWDYDTYSYSMRKCTAEGCSYKDTCTHYNTKKYVVSEDGHYTTCENCKANVTELTAHNYKTYTDITETTHSLSCECGKVSSEVIPHDFEIKHKNGVHWQTCVCGFETDTEDCTYGDYMSTLYVHYKVCSFCEGTGMTETHSHELTEDRKRVCPECLHEEEPYEILIGTWRYSYDGAIYKVTLNADWSYTKVCREGILSSEKELSSGDYSVYYYVGLNGKISGTIRLQPNTGYNISYIEFEFSKGVTDKFRDNDNRLYYKQ